MTEQELTPELAKHLFGPQEVSEERPEGAAGLPPRTKPLNEYTQEEWEAVHEHARRNQLERERVEDSPGQSDEERARRLREQTGIGADSAKDAWNKALVEALHPEERG